MNKLLLSKSKAIYFLMFIFASCQIGKIQCMEEEEEKKAIRAEYKKEKKAILATRQTFIAQQEEKKKEREELLSMIEEDILATKIRTNDKITNLQIRQAWSNAVSNSTSIVAALCTGQIALGLKPQLNDIIANFLTGILLHCSMNKKNTYATTLISASSAGLWLAYTIWRAYNNPYSHWLKSMLNF